MSWKLGKSKAKDAAKSASSSTAALTPTSSDPPSRSITPTPSNPGGSDPPISRTGLLTIRLTAARDLSLPSGVAIPKAIEQMLDSSQAKSVASVTPKSVQEAKKAGKNRDSMQRKQCWWLPYAVLEFDKNEILIDSLGGELKAPVWMYQAHFDVSRISEISIQIYLRSGSSASTTSEKGANGSGSDDMGKSDLFMGNFKLTPDFEQVGMVDEWYDVVGGTGQVNIQVDFKPSNNQSLSIDSFDLLKVIGKGSFGKVMQVRKRDTSRIYALKTLRKAHIASRGEITHTLAERTVLAQVNNPFIVPLKFSFQSEAKLYLVLAFVNGGELFHHLQREQRFNEERSRFYAAELLLALEHLHDFNVVYRDLKPENILLDYTGHIALCDFGLCKLNMTDSETTNTFCGTPEYLAPELLLGQGYTKCVDWWTLGVLLYEMLTGLPPFYDENTNVMYKRILDDPLRFTEDIGPDARSLLTGLLTRDPTQRLGVNGAEDIKKHPFFHKHIDFKKLMAKKIQPPFKPSVASAIDTSNFDQTFTSEPPLDSVVTGHVLSETVQEQFAGFSYEGRADDLGKSLQAGQSYLG